MLYISVSARIIARQTCKSLFSSDITRSLQHKHEQFTKMHTQNKLLSELDALPKDTNVNPLDDKVDALFEPSVILPLWRRVDRHFWWNEWLSKPFMDAGVNALNQTFV